MKAFCLRSKEGNEVVILSHSVNRRAFYALIHGRAVKTPTKLKQRKLNSQEVSKDVQN
jgi:hypothetical protein